MGFGTQFLNRQTKMWPTFQAPSLIVYVPIKLTNLLFVGDIITSRQGSVAAYKLAQVVMTSLTNKLTMALTTLALLSTTQEPYWHGPKMMKILVLRFQTKPKREVWQSEAIMLGCVHWLKMALLSSGAIQQMAQLGILPSHTALAWFKLKLQTTALVVWMVQEN